MFLSKYLPVLICALTACLISTAQTSGSAGRQEGPWTFQRFPAPMDFKGKPAPPILATARERMYRTQIRNQARKGPNFSGHFTLASWGCGHPCVAFVIIDATSGVVYDSEVSVGCANRYGMEEAIGFKLGSRLVTETSVSETAPPEGEVVCGTNYYQWDGKELIFLHFEPWPKSGP